MQNPIQNIRQSSIVFQKPGILKLAIFLKPRLLFALSFLLEKKNVIVKVTNYIIL